MSGLTESSAQAPTLRVTGLKDIADSARKQIESGATDPLAILELIERLALECERHVLARV